MLGEHISLGKILIEAKRNTPVVTKFMVLVNEPNPSIRELRPDLPDPLIELIDRMLAKDTAERPRQFSQPGRVAPPICSSVKSTKSASRRYCAAIATAPRPSASNRTPTPSPFTTATKVRETRCSIRQATVITARASVLHGNELPVIRPPEVLEYAPGSLGSPTHFFAELIEHGEKHPTTRAIAEMKRSVRVIRLK